MAKDENAMAHHSKLFMGKKKDEGNMQWLASILSLLHTQKNINYHLKMEAVTGWQDTIKLKN